MSLKQIRDIYVCVSVHVSAICVRDGYWPTTSRTVPFGDATAVSYEGCARSICGINITRPETFGDTISVSTAYNDYMTCTWCCNSHRIKLQT